MKSESKQPGGSNNKQQIKKSYFKNFVSVGSEGLMCLRHASMDESLVFLWIVVLRCCCWFCLKLCHTLSLDFETN